MTEIQKPVRVAIYTRKSSDEGLDMQFNSLDAQREAGEAYITSQKSKGWVCLPEHYDDGGYSGGNLNRPALERLLADIRAGKIDVVTVYKIDRLSRSLFNFAELLTLFEQHKVDFVSVTQDINTSTSSGRMMLNILITFAQYEREVITERIRDKVAAAKRKGMNCGGPPPLGYISDPATRKLQIVPEEAEVVKRIFSSYLKLGSARDVAAELDMAGLKTRVTVSRRSGTKHGGIPYTGAYIYQVLRNPIYIGLVKHYDQTFPGEHEAILDRKTWDAAQKLLDAQKPYDGKRSKRITPLRGLVRCGCCGGVMKENFTKKTEHKSYRYFVCDRDTKRIKSTCPLKRVPAAELEKLLLDDIAAMLSTPEMLAGVMNAAGELTVNGKRLKSTQVQSAFSDFAKVWDVMFPVERYRFVREVVRQITVFPDKVKIEYNTHGLEQVMLEVEEEAR